MFRIKEIKSFLKKGDTNRTLNVEVEILDAIINSYDIYTELKDSIVKEIAKEIMPEIRNNLLSKKSVSIILNELKLEVIKKLTK